MITTNVIAFSVLFIVATVTVMVRSAIAFPPEPAPSIGSSHSGR